MSHAHTDERAAAILARKATGLLAPDEALIELADADCAATIAAALAERLGLSADVVLHALEAPSDESIAVICRAAGLKMNSFSALLRMRRRGQRGTDNAPAQALSLFSALSRVSAEKRLAALRPSTSRPGGPARRRGFGR